MFKNITTLSVCVAICLLTSLCYGQTEDWKTAIHGKWKCDMEKTLEVLKESGMDEDEMEMMKSFLGGMSMEIGKADIIMLMDAGGVKQENKATYEIEESDEEKSWIKVKVVMEDQPEAKTGEFTLLDQDTMKLNADDGTKIVFARVKEEKKSDDDG